MSKPKTQEEIQAIVDAFHETGIAQKSEAELDRIEGVKGLLKSKKRPKEVVEKIAAKHRGKKNPKKGIRKKVLTAEESERIAANRWKAIHTPDGVFESRRACMEHYGKTYANSTWLNRRLRNDPKNWYYIEKEE